MSSEKLFIFWSKEFKEGTSSYYSAGKFFMKNRNRFFREHIKLSQVEKIEMLTDENFESACDAVGADIIKELYRTGPALLGVFSNERDPAFICVFKDGRKFLAYAPKDFYPNIQKDISLLFPESV